MTRLLHTEYYQNQQKGRHLQCVLNLFTKRAWQLDNSHKLFGSKCS